MDLAHVTMSPSRRCRLVDNMTLRTQLSGLERRVGAGDREAVSHPQHAHRVDHGTISGRSCAKSGHYKSLFACVDPTFVNQ